MKSIRFFASCFLTGIMVNISGYAQNISPEDSLGGAPVPPEIENPECLGINKEPAHATLMPYANLKEALAANRHASSFYQNLNGMWKFNWVAWPQMRPVDFYKPSFNVTDWKEIQVPSNWQILGYGTPYYRGLGYTFRIDFPNVMSMPPKSYTAYEERNPVGSYRRDFNLPADWKGRQVFMTFDGVDAGFFLWVNGEKVGYSVNSRNAAEFDVTKYVKPGKNMVSVEVYRYTSGSYLEDQDMWRLSGIFRNVAVWSTPQQHIRDLFIKTDLDDEYRNATVEITAKVKNYGTQAAKSYKLTAKLYDGEKAVNTAQSEGVVPALQPGQETSVKLSFRVTNPEKWTAETPKLYTTVLTLKDGGKDYEILSARTGFREIEIKGRLFLVNGTPVKLKGVNRHENWPDVGHAVTEAQMVRDLELIKQGNCNLIRTCHYSDNPRWYELCDEYGIFLVAEANVECHGLIGELDREPRTKAAIIDRNVANVENFKNHPSVIIWSMGNECGNGSNFRAALSTIKSIDETRPVHYCDFGMGEENPADIESVMYITVDDLERFAKDTTIKKPFFLAEYAHAMFNSMGALGEYNDIFDKYPELLGGTIWEWQDQGIYNKRDTNHPIIAYGGGFGEIPNDGYFIHKGVVFSDRSLKPHYPEMKKAYQWIGISAEDLQKGIIKIHNKYQFINLDGFVGSWTLSENGNEISHGAMNVPNLIPGAEALITIPYKPAKINEESEYFLRISFALAKDQIWAKKGFELASQQFKIPSKTLAAKPEPNPVNPLTLTENDNEVTVKGTGFTVVFDKVTGTFSSFEKNGVNLLLKDGGPRLHLWRAPHRDDDNWADSSWVTSGLRELKWTTQTVAYEQKSPSTVTITVNLYAKGKNNFTVNHNVVYTISGDGSIKSENTFSSSNPQQVVARIGVRMLLNKQFDQVSYFGRGPMENYVDRKRGFDVGIYKSTIKEQLTPYEKPMDCGNHEDVRWAKVTTASGNGLMIQSDNTLMQISALPYSDEEMDKVEYRVDLPPSSATVFCISHLTLGVGSAGCGPGPLPQYIVYAAPTSFTYTIRLL